MSRYEFKLPDIGEGVTEGQIVKWLIATGDVVVEDQPMVEVMTDKATVTITAPKAGKVLETRGKEDETVAVHSVLVVFDVGGGAEAGAATRSPGEARGEGAPEARRAPGGYQPGGAATDLSTALAAEPTAATPGAQPQSMTGGADGPAATAVGDIREDLPGMNLMARPAAQPNGGGQNGHASQGGYFNAKPLATPATRKLARDLGVDLHRVPPTGSNGRVTKDDVRGLVARPNEGAAAQSDSTPTMARSGRAEAPAPLRVPPPPGGAGEALEDRQPLRGVRKRIFEGMSRSKHTAAHFTFVEECDVGALKALRERLKPAAEKAGVKLSFLPFFVKAVVAALKRHPTLNSAFDETTQEIVVRRYYDIGIASATEAGLMVPVVRAADKKSILDIARDIQRLGEATKSGKVTPQDLGGSTFTITSLGSQGGLFATPILNMPEVGILGIHQIKEKPVVKNGKIVIGEVMLVSLSFDHRIIDGHVGAAFAYEIIGYLEDPDRLFLEMS
ncbi:MAG: dihydrolipoamide acetyltransferase family protein [Polyangiaceae bacterium]